MYTPSVSGDRVQTQLRINTFVHSVYNWMAVGLALTGFVGYFVSETALFNALGPLFIPIALAQLGLVLFLSFRINKMQASTATTMFVVYAILNGVTFSVLFKLYAMTTIATVFFICSGMFAALSLYGWTTKKSLTGLGNFMFMGLVGMIIATLVNVIFIKSSAMQMIISYIGVLVFAGLTAYDTQTIKEMALSQPAGLDAAVVRKGAIIGALNLYLDFLLLFKYLLFILGGSRD